MDVALATLAARYRLPADAAFAMFAISASGNTRAPYKVVTEDDSGRLEQ